MNYGKTIAAGVAILGLTLAIGLTSISQAGRYGAPSAKERARVSKLNTCLWEGPVGARGMFSNDTSTIKVSNQYPDKAAVYWIARFSVEPGAVLTIRNSFPHARYMSYNAYDGDGQPFTALADYEIRPDRGSSNPFKIGALRTVRKRKYTVRAVAEPEPARLAANTIYLGAAGEDGRVTGTIMYRVYIPDRGYGIPGGAGLPRVSLEYDDGRRFSGAALCQETETPKRGMLRNPSISATVFKALVDADGNPAAAPVRKTSNPKFETFFNSTYAILGAFQTAEQQATMDSTQKGGFYSTEHNRYVFSLISGQFGKLFVVRGKLPTTTPTYEGQKRVRQAQMRFFSICMGESPATGQTSDCANDLQLKTDHRGFYEVVISKPGDRPWNAREKCGVTWLNWGKGDGFEGGRPDFGIVIARNMLPAPWFRQSVFSVTEPGDEHRVMGPYLPRGHYSSKAAFAKKGC